MVTSLLSRTYYASIIQERDMTLPILKYIYINKYILSAHQANSNVCTVHINTISINMIHIEYIV